MANASFLPEDYVIKKVQRRTNVICMVLFTLVLVGIVGAWVTRMREAAREGADSARVDAQLEEAAKRLDQLDQLQEKKAQMLQKAKVTSVLLERVPRSLILSELINNMPGMVSFLDFGLETHVVQTPMRATTVLDKARQEQKAAAARAGQPEVNVPNTETRLTLTGIAPTDVQVAQYMTSLGRSPLFADLNLSFSEEVTIDDRIMRRFGIDMKIDQNVDLAKVEPTKVKRTLASNPWSDTLQIDGSGNMVAPGEQAKGRDANIVPTHGK